MPIKTFWVWHQRTSKASSTLVESFSCPGDKYFINQHRGGGGDYSKLFFVPGGFICLMPQENWGVWKLAKTHKPKNENHHMGMFDSSNEAFWCTDYNAKTPALCEVLFLKKSRKTTKNRNFWRMVILGNDFHFLGYNGFLQFFRPLVEGVKHHFFSFLRKIFSVFYGIRHIK